ncbi:MAG: lipid-A-disaccharide synthase [Alphaproteobacteria bacterium]|nr:lipid-A-disaccharide synthase [Alphaproteobacteria bacterium]
MTLNDEITIFIVAGEPSGDLLASRLMAALERATDKKICFVGVGGETMKKCGFDSLFDISDLAIMGLAEVIPRIPLVLKRVKQTVDEIIKLEPDVVITVDSWGFTGRVNKSLQKKGSKIPRIHYVAPQVWAWRANRATKMAGVVNHLLALLPNEPEYFEPHGLPTTHVGHPIVECRAAFGNGEELRKRCDISKNATVLCVLPGSRHNETKRLLPVFQKPVDILSKRFKNLHVIIPTVPTVAGEVIRKTAEWSVPITVVSGEKDRYDAFAASDAAMAASGTVALELAIAKVPHVIAYKLSFITAFLAKKLVKIRFAKLLNLFTDKEIIPELLLDNCTPEKLANEVENLLKDKKIREEQIQEATKALAILGHDKKLPSDNAANVVLDIIEKRS